MNGRNGLLRTVSLMWQAPKLLQHLDNVLPGGVVGVASTEQGGAKADLANAETRLQDAQTAVGKADADFQRALKALKATRDSRKRAANADAATARVDISQAKSRLSSADALLQFFN